MAPASVSDGSATMVTCRAATVGLVGALAAGAALAAVPVPDPLPTAGVPLLREVTFGHASTPVLVSPHRPGRNLVHVGNPADVQVGTTRRETGRMDIFFYPNGRIDQAIVHLTDVNNHVMGVFVEPVTAMIRITDHRIDPPRPWTLPDRIRPLLQPITPGLRPGFPPGVPPGVPK